MKKTSPSGVYELGYNYPVSGDDICITLYYKFFGNSTSRVGFSWASVTRDMDGNGMKRSRIQMERFCGYMWKATSSCPHVQLFSALALQSVGFLKHKPELKPAIFHFEGLDPLKLGMDGSLFLYPLV